MFEYKKISKNELEQVIKKSLPILIIPEVGNIFRSKANHLIIKRPKKNAGIEMPRKQKKVTR